MKMSQTLEIHWRFIGNSLKIQFPTNFHMRYLGNSLEMSNTFGKCKVSSIISNEFLKELVFFQCYTIKSDEEEMISRPARHSVFISSLFLIHSKELLSLLVVPTKQL